jgi:hypothetical protein
VAFGDRKRAKEAEHQAEVEREQQALLEQLLGAIDGGAPLANVPLATKGAERPLFVVHDAGLFEPLSAGGRWEGRSAGFSVPIPDLPHTRFRVGKTRGHYVRSPETPTVIDKGDVTITDRRVVFQGRKQVREWAWNKLLGLTHDDKRCATAILVTNREKVSGITYEGVEPAHVHLALEVAAAIADGHEADAVSELRGLLKVPAEEVGAEEPSPAIAPTAAPSAAPSSPAPAPTPHLPGEWAPDPSGRHQLRWWDGTEWTSHVADNGVTGEDGL